MPNTVQTSCGEEDGPSHRMDRTSASAREEEVLAQSRARGESSCECPASSRDGTRRTGAQQNYKPSSGGKDSSSQQGDRIKINTQQRKYKISRYETSFWEEGISSQWVDRIKTIAREDEVLAQYSDTQEKFSKQRVDRTQTKIPQAKDQQQISSWEEDGSSH